jgi:hypothetical protein
MATICETFATESRGSPVASEDSAAFPGAPASSRLDVRGTQTTVAIRLWLNAFPWTMRTGRRRPGPGPTGSGSSAHQISPCPISSRLAPGLVERSLG